jgi:hypothetical protein
MNTVIRMPLDNDMPVTKKQARSRINMIRKEYCDEISSDVFQAIISHLNSYGVIFRESDDHTKDLVFLEESLKSFIYRSKGIKHNFHKMAENAVELKNED